MENKETSLQKYKNRTIVQSFIISEARYSSNIFEKRLISNLMALLQDYTEGIELRGKVQPNPSLFDDKGLYIELPIAELMTDEDTENKNYTPYKKALKSLRNRTIDVEAYDKRGEKYWAPVGLIEKPKLYERGLVSFEIAGELVDAFLDFSKGFSRYFLNISLNLKSSYSMRLYEIVSGNNPLTFKLDTLKKMFGVVDKYADNSNFIKRCIESAKKELDANANYSFTYQCIKKGRKIDKIRLIPFPYPERETEEYRRKEASRRAHLSWFYETEVRQFLSGVCHFDDKGMRGENMKTFQRFVFNHPQDALNRMKAFWKQAQEKGDNPKKYFVKCIQNDNEQFN